MAKDKLDPAEAGNDPLPSVTVAPAETLADAHRREAGELASLRVSVNHLEEINNRLQRRVTALEARLAQPQG